MIPEGAVRAAALAHWGGSIPTAVEGAALKGARDGLAAALPHLLETPECFDGCLCRECHDNRRDEPYKRSRDALKARLRELNHAIQSVDWGEVIGSVGDAHAEFHCAGDCGQSRAIVAGLEKLRDLASE